MSSWVYTFQPVVGRDVLSSSQRRRKLMDLPALRCAHQCTALHALVLMDSL